MVKAHLDQSRLVIWVLSFCGAVTASDRVPELRERAGSLAGFTACIYHTGVYVPYHTHTGAWQGVVRVWLLGPLQPAPCPARPAVAPLPSGAGHAEPGRLPAAAAAFLSWLIADKTGRP